MKRMLLLLIPVVLFAQVEVDTIIRLGASPNRGYFIPELNKLYLTTQRSLIALDCSTYQANVIPIGDRTDIFAYRPLGSKLYVGPTHGLFVIDATADTIITQLHPPGEHANSILYIPSRDRLYIGGPYGMSVVDCATDSIIKVIHSPVPGYTTMYQVSYDSVGDRIWVYTGNYWQGQPYFVVYDSTDSLLRVLPDTIKCWPTRIFFCSQMRKGYYTNADDADGYPGVVDAKNLRIIKSFPFYAYPEGVGASPLAVNTRNCKVYIPGWDSNYNNVLCVIDCSTDSVLKWFRLPTIGGIEGGVWWVPWSNRVYASTIMERFLVVDCATDSIIIPNLILPGQQWAPWDIEIDPIRQRIFVIGADTTAVYVLRDVVPGVDEHKRAKFNTPHSTLNATIIHNVLVLEGREKGAGSSLCLLDVTGRKVLDLKPGENNVRALVPGVYFIKNRLTDAKAARVVITR